MAFDSAGAMGFIASQMQPLMNVTTASTITPSASYASPYTATVAGTFTLAGMTPPAVIQLGPITVTSPLPVAYNYFGTVTGTITGYSSLPAGTYTVQAYRLIDTLYPMTSSCTVGAGGAFTLDLSTTPAWQTGGMWAFALLNSSGVRQGSLWQYPSFSGLSVQSWVITDTSYLIATEPAAADGTFSFGVTQAGRKMFQLVDASGDILAAYVPVTGNIRSYVVTSGQAGYVSNQGWNVQCFANQCYSYDQAICLRAAVAAGDYPMAQQLASGLLQMQTPSGNGASTGGFIFSGQQLSPSYGDKSYRTGAHAICIRALLEYMQAWPADALTAAMAGAVDGAFTWLATMLSSTSPTTGLYFGGTGVYSGTPQVFSQGADITWIASEHQFDIYAAFRLAAVVLATPSYATQAASLASAILALLWDSTHNRFFQGYDPSTTTPPGTTDPGDPLDMHSWGASFLISLGGQSAKVASILSPAELAPFVVTEGAVTGYAPDYAADPGYAGATPTIWTEGTGGLAVAVAQSGDIAGCNSIISAIAPMQNSDGSFPYTTVYDPVTEMSVSKACIGGAWMILAAIAGTVTAEVAVITPPVSCPLSSPTYTVTGADGSVWAGNFIDSSGNAWVVEHEDGWSGSPPARPAQADKTVGDGTWAGTGYYSGRLVTLTGTCIAGSQIAMLWAKEAIHAAVDPHNLATLRVDELHLSRTAQVRLADQIEIQDKSSLAFTFTIGLFAPDPRRYAAVTETMTTGLPAGVTAGRTYPRTYPVLYGGLGLTAAGSVEFWQQGTYKQTPGIITFSGPLIDPSVIHVQSGKTLTFGLTLNWQQTLVVDLGAQSAMLGGTASVINTLTGSSAWFMLARGVNQLEFRGEAGPVPPGVAAVPAMQLTAASAWS